MRSVTALSFAFASLLPAQAPTVTCTAVGFLRCVQDAPTGVTTVATPAGGNLAPSASLSPFSYATAQIAVPTIPAAPALATCTMQQSTFASISTHGNSTIQAVLTLTPSQPMVVVIRLHQDVQVTGFGGVTHIGSVDIGNDGSVEWSLTSPNTGNAYTWSQSLEQTVALSGPLQIAITARHSSLAGFPSIYGTDLTTITVEPAPKCTGAAYYQCGSSVLSMLEPTFGMVDLVPTLPNVPIGTPMLLVLGFQSTFTGLPINWTCPLLVTPAITQFALWSAQPWRLDLHAAPGPFQLYAQTIYLDNGTLGGTQGLQLNCR